MIQAILGLVPGLFQLGGKLIEDKDKRNEYAFKVLEMTHEMSLKLIEMKTYPWVDALVKLAYASEAIIKGLFRPVASVGALVFLGYCQIKGIELSPVVEGVLVALAPAWGYSRYKEKMTKNDVGELGW